MMQIIIYITGFAGLATFIAAMATHTWLEYRDGNLGLWEKQNRTNLSAEEPPKGERLTFSDCSGYVDGTRACMILGTVTVVMIIASAVLWERRQDSAIGRNLFELLMVLLSILVITAVSLYGHDAKDCYTKKYSLSDVRLGGSFIAACVSPVLLIVCVVLRWYEKYQEHKASGNQVKPKTKKLTHPDKPFYENDPLAPASSPAQAQGPSTSRTSPVSQRVSRSSSSATNNVFTIEINNLNNRPHREPSAVSRISVQNQVSTTSQPQTGSPLTPDPNNAFLVTPASVSALPLSDNPPVYTIYVNPDTLSPPPSYEEVLQQGTEYAEAPAVVTAKDAAVSKV